MEKENKNPNKSETPTKGEEDGGGPGQLKFKSAVFNQEPIVQDIACYLKHNTAPTFSFCLECSKREKDFKKKEIIVCRFIHFRKIIKRVSDKRTTYLYPSGFCDPFQDPTTDDLSLWLPSKYILPSYLDLELCKDLIHQLGDQFCFLIHQELDVMMQNMTSNKTILWKKTIEGIREMCDVCSTTVFNYHWNCDRCGFMTCTDCFKSKINDQHKECKWIDCIERDSKVLIHEPDKLILTQIIPGNALIDINKLLHQMRHRWDIPQLCGCPELENSISIQDEQNLDNNIISSHSNTTESEPVIKHGPPPTKMSRYNEDYTSSDYDSDKDEELDPTFFISLFGKRSKCNENDFSIIRTYHLNTWNKISIPTEIQVSSPPILHNNGSQGQTDKLQHFVRVNKSSYYNKPIPPIQIMTHADSKSKWPNIPHIWLCSGSLLRLTDPSYEDNYPLFKYVWMRGQPVLVSNVGTKLNADLWTPAAFSKDFGQQQNDLINCKSGKILPKQFMKKFWDGFIDVSKRLKDEHGDPMLLKLKDWPPGDDFAKILPERFEDLMSALPLKEYTHRTGKLNLAARLPDHFIKPDLGPKMYIAYGDASNLEKGTTNLHLDISDAVNVMVHICVPILSETDLIKHNKDVLQAIIDSDCCKYTIRRVTNEQEPELAGALWHIYRPCDADKIRDLINKVFVERGHAIEPEIDPIHDQVMYLDTNLRTRLREEYNVQGYPILQCKGDAVFIPAGAPHQVRNLQNCIKIAEDFVSPENVSHCFRLTQEFRKLSDSHTNHEDKLQIKNIIYHAVKDALSVLLSTSK